MADLIIGYPSNLTTVSSGGGGLIRVTWEPWELDWEFFDLIAIDGSHYLANTTTGVTRSIVDKGGSEHLGYWIEIAQAFPNGNWNTGDRITPQRQIGINQFATFAAAIAAAALYDVFLVWYEDLNNRRVWAASLSCVNTAVSVWGMLSRNQLHLQGAASATIGYSGNLLAQVEQVFVRNLTVWSGVYSIVYNPTAGQAGFGIRITRVSLPRGQVILGTYAVGGAFQIDNCFIMGRELNTYGVYAPNAAGLCLFYNNTIMDCYIGLWLVNRAHTVTNCVISECATGVLQGAAATLINCADTDGTLPVHATNLRNQDARTQLQFFYDLASPGRKKFAYDGRIVLDSVVVAKGVALPAVPRDADGRLRPNPPAMGAYEPYPVAYAPAAEIIRGTSKRGVVA